MLFLKGEEKKNYSIGCHHNQFDILILIDRDRSSFPYFTVGYCFLVSVAKKAIAEYCYSLGQLKGTD